MTAPATGRDVNTRLGALESRMEGLERSQADIHSDTREARDGVREIMVTLREQNALERVAEVRSEGRQQNASLREDVVAANTRIRDELKTLTGRVDALDTLKTQAQGAAKGGKWLLDTLKIVAGAGGGALVLKLLEVMK